jgi:hypothetical protein
MCQYLRDYVPPFLLLLNIHLPIKYKYRQTMISYDGIDRLAGSSFGKPMMNSLQRTIAVLPAWSFSLEF